MAPGTKVYVRWYGNVLEGEVADGEGFMGMTPVRIPLDGHHPVALFFPQHVYDSPELLTGISEDQSKVDESLTKVDNNRSKVVDPVQQFKESHWDEAHNHLRVDSLDEFYRLWRAATSENTRATSENTKATSGNAQPSAKQPTITRPYPAITQGYYEITKGYPSAGKPCQSQPVPQNGTPSNTKQLHKKKPAKAVELSLFD